MIIKKIGLLRRGSLFFLYICPIFYNFVSLLNKTVRTLDKIELIKEGKRVIDEEINALSKLSSHLGEDFATAVEMISESGKVIVSGIGKSGMIGRKIAATLSSTGVPAIFLHPVEALHGDLGVVGKGDTAILLSKSGSTDEITRLVPFIRSRKAGIISIVGNMKSFLGKNSDIALDGSVDREACSLNLAPTSSSMAALAIGDALAVASMMCRGVTLEDFSRLHPLGQIGRNITLKVKDVMHSGEDLPVIDAESKFTEAIIEITDKTLGCVCVVDSNSDLKGIITDGDVRRALHNNYDIKNLNVTDVMTSSPVTVNEEIYLGEALAIMENRSSQISVLPVVKNQNTCTGVIRIHDIVRSGI
jgi:arabinose-5-phosphate isomerase